VLGSFVLAVLLYLVTIRSHLDQAPLLLVPALAALAARVRYLAAVTLILLVVPLTWTIRADAKLTHASTVAAAWIALHRL
jgi:hypothetical protein